LHSVRIVRKLSGHLAELTHFERLIKSFDDRFDQDQFVEVFAGEFFISCYCELFLPCLFAYIGPVYAKDGQLRVCHDDRNISQAQATTFK